MNLPNEHLLQNGKYRLTHVVGQGGFGITRLFQKTCLNARKEMEEKNEVTVN